MNHPLQDSFVSFLRVLAWKNEKLRFTRKNVFLKQISLVLWFHVKSAKVSQKVHDNGGKISKLLRFVRAPFSPFSNKKIDRDK